jgi:hypothetical protein
MDAKKWAEAEAEVPGLGKVLDNAAAAIEKAAHDLEAAASAGR